MADTVADHKAGQQIAENQKKEREAGHKKEHDRLIESEKVKFNGKSGRPTDLKTDFMQYSINGLRRMILDSNPGKISEVGGHWKKVHEILSGGDGDGKAGGVDATPAKGSIAGLLQTAVDNALEHWEGQAAQSFRRKAEEIGVDIRNGSAHANLTAEQLFAIGKDLDAAKAKMQEIEDPSLTERAGDKANDDGRSDAQMKKDLAAGVRADTAAQANEKQLSLGKERQLQAVAVMEDLAANYKVYTKNLKSGGNVGDHERVGPPDPNVNMPPPITSPGPSGGGPGASKVANKPWSAGGVKPIGNAPTVPRAKGITGGAQLPPTTGTNVDSIKPGLTGSGLGTPPSSSGIGTTGGGGGGGVPGGGIAPAGGASLGRAARSGIGGPGARGGLAGGAAAGRGTGGRAGMGGMGGGAGAGAAGRGGAGAGGRGALAKARGGVVGAAKGPSGKGTGAGAGLHGSRGGTQRGGMAGGMGGGMGRGGRRSEEENSRGERPDYLVEDEETWVSEEDRKRNVPRNIE